MLDGQMTLVADIGCGTEMPRAMNASAARDRKPSCAVLVGRHLNPLSEEPPLIPPEVAIARRVDYHHIDLATALEQLDVDPANGLGADEVDRRRADHGRNELDEVPRDPAWKRFFGQFRDLLILILIAAAAVSFVASGEIKTPLVVLVVVLLNAMIGFVQENKAEASLDALRKMLVTPARVLRGGRLQTVPAHDLVPGDIVAVQAGDRIPADGRLLAAVQLELDEAALTGESMPAEKTTTTIDEGDERGVAVGDRHNMAYMNTTVTRGRGEIVVTGTGMSTEIGRIAGMLRDTTTDKTPLQHQLDGLATSLAKLAGVIVVAMFAIGLRRGQSFADLFLTAVALAVASIPEGLPAVTAVTLAIGVSKMAKQNAIVKRLASVETLGCTSVICTDKTGTPHPQPDDGPRARRRQPPLLGDRRGLRPHRPHHRCRRRRPVRLPRGVGTDGAVQRRHAPTGRRRTLGRHRQPH